MNFEDERYVRVYTRKTVTVKLLGWEGRMVLHALFLEVDRAGVLDLDGQDPADAIAALADIPVEHARVGMARVLERGCAVLDGGRLVVPRFIEAQEARQSDAQRQRDSRARRAALTGEPDSMTRLKASVTNRDHIESQSVADTPGSVTRGHTESPAVTNGHSVLSRAVPSLAVPSIPPNPPSGGKPPRAAKPKRVLLDVSEWPGPTEAHRALAKECRVNVEREATGLRDWAKSKGERKVDWNAAFNGWLRRAGERSAPPPGLQQHSQFGGRTQEGPPREFDAVATAKRINADLEAKRVEDQRRRDAAAALRQANDGR